MNDALEDHIGTISIGAEASQIFASLITLMAAGSEQELANLVRRLDETPATYGMEGDQRRANQVDGQQHDDHHS